MGLEYSEKEAEKDNNETELQKKKTKTRVLNWWNGAEQSQQCREVEN